ncbi:MAG: sulfite exporter TauE/SafE family protein [Euryarchaeota archaeon]|nr:sulfite exporter TauE/SafE family protein [Euryarchaeota archaeon]MDE1836962.1 sulfite exporter TauE/SafE family protein [Euryarchaeota archaeon]MDE2045853.1 sulfite exporter TauE/SafE family protein [Thermoplasmata archaeon]
MLLWVILLLLIAVGVAGGLLGSLAGLGGGVVIVPILVIGLGVPLLEAIGASAVSVLATSTTTGAAYVRDHITDVRIGMFLEIATVPGALLGVTATLVLAKVGLQPLLLFILGVVLLITVLDGVRHRPAGDQPVPADARSLRLHLEGSYLDLHDHREVRYRAGRTNPAFATMFGAGLVSGMFGIGSGALKVTALERFLGLPVKVATATSNFMIGVTVAASSGILLLAGAVNPLLAAPVALGTVTGSFLGSRILPRARNEILRVLFLGAVAALATELVLRGAGVA